MLWCYIGLCQCKMLYPAKRVDVDGPLVDSRLSVAASATSAREYSVTFWYTMDTMLGWRIPSVFVLVRLILRRFAAFLVFFPSESVCAFLC
jgi:hypothetical protein